MHCKVRRRELLHGVTVLFLFYLILGNFCLIFLNGMRLFEFPEKDKANAFLAKSF